MKVMDLKLGDVFVMPGTEQWWQVFNNPQYIEASGFVYLEVSPDLPEVFPPSTCWLNGEMVVESGRSES